jgi:protein-tyrosine phosphatase
MREILVVCHGNICRSPIGERVLQRVLDERLGAGTFLVSSAGIAAHEGSSATSGTITALAQRGIDATGHCSRYLTAAMARRAWRIYCMERYQLNHIRSMVDDPAKVMLFAGEEVPDPLGSNQKAYEKVARQIERLMPAVVDDIERSLRLEPSREMP